VNTIGESYLTYLYSPARKRAFTKKNILAGWAKTVLSSFNPDKVLQDIPKPVTLDISATFESNIDPYLEVATIQAPATPITPTTTEAILSIQGLIRTMLAHSVKRANKA